MTKKLFLSQIKSLLIPGLIIGGILILIGINLGMGCQTYSVAYRGASGFTTTPTMATVGLFVSACVLSTAMAIAVSSYRFSLKKADTYFQAPYQDGTIKRTRILVGLMFVVAATIAAYLILLNIYAIRTAIEPLPTKVYPPEIYILTRATFNYGMIAAEFFVIIAMVTCSYFISLFFALQTSSLPNAIIITCGALLVLGLGWFVIKTIFEEVCYHIGSSYESFKTPYLPRLEIGYVGGVSRSIDWLFEMQILNLEPITHAENVFEEVFPLISTGLLGTGLAVPCFLQKEISGEYCGKGENKNSIQKVVHHIFNILVLMIISAICTELAAFIIYIFILLFAVSTYFMITVWLNRTFKLKLADWLPIVLGSMLSMSLAFMFVLIKAFI